MSEVTSKQERYVNGMVATLLERHQTKLMELNPLPETKASIAEFGSKDMVAAYTALDKLSDELESLQEEYASAYKSFDAVHGADANSMLQEKCEAVREGVLVKQSAFEFKIRRALGQVTLVGAEAAFQTIDECRNEIEAMK